jgi:hypothetical protein
MKIAFLCYWLYFVQIGQFGCGYEWFCVENYTYGDGLEGGSWYIVLPV